MIVPESKRKHVGSVKTTGGPSSRKDLLNDHTEAYVRAYTVWPSRNTFCCYGHFMTGPKEDFGPNACAWGLVLGIICLFFYVWGGTLVNVSIPLLVFLSSAFISTIFWFLATSFTDPGILLRKPAPANQMPPLYRNRIEGDRTVTDTWCTTCHIYRPPRASHCPDCDNCVRDFDHHCPFTRNCIGARNYPFFILFLVSVSISLGGLIFSCVVLASSDSSVLENGAFGPEHNPWQLNGFFNMTLIFVSVLLGLVLWGFTAYHLSLLITGFTSKERLRGRKNGAKSIALYERVGCCHPSELQPRRLILQQPIHNKADTIPTISDAEL